MESGKTILANNFVSNFRLVINSERSESSLSEFLLKYDSKNLVMEKTYFKNPENPRCIDLFLTNSVQSFQNTSIFLTGIPDIHKMILTVLKTSFPKSASKNYKIIKFLNQTLLKVT